MNLVLQRLFLVDGAQLGLLSVDEGAICWTLEDEPREEKIPGETCIPAGRYELELRTHGRLFERYSKAYPWHAPGMLELKSVPGFTDVLIHAGNRKEHTRGCVLVGYGAFVYGLLSESFEAYHELYKLVSRALIKKEPTYLEIRSEGKQHGTL